jgi:hypothetical protein
MKKSLVLFMALLMAASAVAQEGDLKKQFYLRVGLSVPGWKYYGFNGKSDWEEMFAVNEVKRSGGAFEFGSIYMLNSIPLMDGMRLGINVDYLSVAAHHFSYEGTNASSTLMFVGSKIGPSFSYSPVKHLVFDTYVKFNPVWLAANYDKNLGIDDEEFWGGYMGMKFSIGMNVRYSVLMMGLEFNPGYAKMKYWDKDIDDFTDEYLGNVDDLNSKKTPVPCMNFWLGLSF